MILHKAKDPCADLSPDLLLQAAMLMSRSFRGLLLSIFASGISTLKSPLLPIALPQLSRTEMAKKIVVAGGNGFLGTANACPTYPVCIDTLQGPEYVKSQLAEVGT